jgi:phage shock protein PspC (stress-responsive transcriptional regulator)
LKRPAAGGDSGPTTGPRPLTGSQKPKPSRLATTSPRSGPPSPTTASSKAGEEAAGAGVLIRTGEEFGAALAEAAGADVELLRVALLLFAVVSMFVAGIVIYNTFAILIAQRQRELALLRCVGAKRSQVFRSMLAESLAVGLVALAGVAGCRSDPSVAAYVGDEQVTVDELQTAVDTRLEDPALAEAAAGREDEFTRLVLNRQNNYSGIPTRDIAENLGREIEYEIPEDVQAVLHSINEGSPLVESRPDHRISQEIQRLASSMIDVEALDGAGDSKIARSGFMSRLRTAFRPS